jgi:hypothetical protein
MACCGTRYYCTAGGPVAVEPDDDGWYEVPEGGTSGWYKTEAEALEECPVPALSLVCEGVTYTIPASVTVNFTDLDPGLYEEWGDTNSVAVPLTLVGDTSYSGAVQLPNPLIDRTWTVSVSVECDGGDLTVTVGVACAAAGVSACPPLFAYSFTSSTAPWTTSDATATKTVTGGGLAYTAPEPVASGGYFSVVLT